MIAQEFSSAHDMMEHYAETRHRLWHVPAKPMRAIPQAPIAVAAAEPEPEQLRFTFTAPIVEVEDMTWRHIATQVCRKHDISFGDITAPLREERFVDARQELYYRLRTERSMSFPMIGRLLNRDQSTVRHGCTLHQKMMNGYRRNKAVPYILTEDQQHTAKAMFEDGCRYAEIARVVGLRGDQVSNYFNNQRIRHGYGTTPKTRLAKMIAEAQA